MKGVYFIFKMVYNLFCYKVHKQKQVMIITKIICEDI